MAYVVIASEAPIVIRAKRSNLTGGPIVIPATVPIAIGAQAGIQ